MRATSLLCRLGKHAPIANGRWNAGYCFTTCARCGRDMVRSVFGEWHVPRDFRVVWGVRREADDDAGIVFDRHDLTSLPTTAEHDSPANASADPPIDVPPIAQAIPQAIAYPPTHPVEPTDDVDSRGEYRSPFDFSDVDPGRRQPPEPSPFPPDRPANTATGTRRR